MNTEKEVRPGLRDDLGDRLVGLREVADVLSVSLRSVQRLIAGHTLPNPVKVGRSSRLYLSDVRNYMSKLHDEYRRA